MPASQVQWVDLLVYLVWPDESSRDEMTDIRTRLADEVAGVLETKQDVDLSIPFARGRVALRITDVLLSLPGIAITELPDRLIFTLCKHCNRAISLNPKDFIGHQPDWSGRRYWCHFHLVDDDHLPEPKKPFAAAFWPQPT